VSVQEVSSNSTNSARFFPISKGEKGTPDINETIRLFQTPEYADVKVSISEDAQRLYTLMRTEDVEAVALKRYEEFLNLSDQLSSANALMSEKSADFLNAASAYFMGDGRASIRDEFFNAFTDAEIYSVYEYAARLFREISSVSSGDANDTGNLVSIANKYGELVMDIEERYSGGELEKQRAYLSAAFDLTVGIYGKERASRVERALMFEALKVRSHNHWRNTPFGSTIFDMGAIVINDKEMAGISEKVNSGFSKSISHYAELIKRFVLENGFVTSEHGNDALANYLADTELPEGGFTLDELHSINELLKESIDPDRKTTLFHQLSEFFSER